MNWRSKNVFVTGHTGFKGGWLSLWLHELGATVCGYALEPNTTPNFYEECGIFDITQSTLGDVRDLDSLKAAMCNHESEVVFHLAAQPLVRRSYQDPITTYSTNVLGTVHVLEAARACPTVRAIVVITTDKCYENREWVYAYRETDRLGGYDPYSSSKACAELVTDAYRNSYFNTAKYGVHRVGLASARAGNVIGGGDWSDDRLIPDIMRGFLRREVVRIRRPKATRPWQHVLEPLRGYLMLAEALCDGPGASQAWNFGPDPKDSRPVEFVVKHFARSWSRDADWETDSNNHPHEASMLTLDCSKARAELGWEPVLSLTEALDLTSSWYQSWAEGADMRDVSLRQIREFSKRTVCAAKTAAGKNIE